MMEVVKDAEQKRLVFIGNTANPGFWDNHWHARIADALDRGRSGSWVSRETRKYLQPGSIVLEGGCGTGLHVSALAEEGFRPIGIDYAPRTVTELNKLAPELDFRLGDVRELPLEDSSVDGYWSLGVIEHFWSGYDGIASEMARVVRPGGFLFLTFPWMSPLRRCKVSLSLYPERYFPSEPTGFYQFALSRDEVVGKLSKHGLKLRTARANDGIKGVKDEIRWLKPVLQRLYDAQSLPGRINRRLLSTLLQPLGHMCYCVFERTHTN